MDLDKICLVIVFGDSKVFSKETIRPLDWEHVGEVNEYDRSDGGDVVAKLSLLMREKWLS